MSLTVEQLTKGIRYWRTTDWPQDFHNSYYERVLAGVRITNGTFDLQWWNRSIPSFMIGGQRAPLHVFS